MKNRKELKTELTTYIDKYLNRNWIKMTAVLRGIKRDLLNDDCVDSKALKSVLGLLKKEKKFSGLSDKEISDYFRPLFVKPDTTNTLENFL